ncbi:exonuclease 1-like [Sinocyclocheilus rhinocerous]|uniref:exonuclease 1-like n=1 Tax=Sinocyclocheilus rhinocerous TaxID=307959 RepID=UPI0007B9D1D8|nr:PREDICTED: exonuclease 1-like [Sinocyclocheilus rhinocerous]
MGIQGLLQFIKDASEPISVKKYRGQTVAVDTYCWLHKGAFSCAEKLAKGEPTDQYVSYCMKFVDMLRSFGVKPILVFDGRNLPSKKEVEKSRRERRQANLQKGKQLLREGKISEARECFTRSVNITPSMAHDVIKTARMRGVDCVVAPYEADAQLAFLNKSGIAQAVITEDSDLLAFGCKKPSKAARSSSWNDRCDKNVPLQISIWSKNYEPGSTQPKSPTTPKRPPPTRGKEKIISVQSLKMPQRESQVKRPREDTSLSVDDLLGQYSAGVKRRCPETPPTTEPLIKDNIVSKEKGCGSTVGLCRPRNRFATLLQWRTQSEEGTEEQVTHSRFFCHGESNMAEAQKDALNQDSPQPARSLETSVSQSEGNAPALCQDPDPEREQAKEESSSPSASPSRSSRPASLGLRVFSWSGSTRELNKSASQPPTVTTDRHRSSTPSGLSTLQQFHRKKGSFSWVGSGLSLSSSSVEGTEDAEKSPGSPPSQDSAYFSQSSSISAGVEDSLVTEDNSDKVRNSVNFDRHF